MPEHALAGGELARVVGRAVDVDDDLRAGLPLQGHGAEGVPDVLTDVHADGDAADGVDGADAAGAEVAVLIKDAVVGQVDLVVDAHELAVAGEGGGVVDLVALAVHKADDDGDAPGGGDDLIEGGEVVADEGGLEEQVLGRVAGEHELGEGDEVGLPLAGLLDAAQDDAGVAGDVADGGVHLRQGQSKGPHGLLLLD